MPSFANSFIRGPSFCEITSTSKPALISSLVSSKAIIGAPVSDISCDTIVTFFPLLSVAIVGFSSPGFSGVGTLDSEASAFSIKDSNALISREASTPSNFPIAFGQFVKSGARGFFSFVKEEFK